VYQERPSRLPGSVVWRRLATPGDVRILPDGSMDLIWTSDGDLLVAGPDTRSHTFSGRPGVTLVGVRFAPGVGPSVIGVPAHEVRDQRLPLDAIWNPADVRRLAEQIAAASRPGEAIEQVAAARLDDAGPHAATTAEIVRLIRSGRRIAEVADAVGLSERHLRRRSLDLFGYGPKTLGRILRLGRAVDLARAGWAFADLADESGYADQAHLARDVRSLAGVSLTALSR
jgi:AraC-like DNA-binding protein